jgi:hypothetical protein
MRKSRSSITPCTSAVLLEPMFTPTYLRSCESVTIGPYPSIHCPPEVLTEKPQPAGLRGPAALLSGQFPSMALNKKETE